jgi:hypothetical protein
MKLLNSITICLPKRDQDFEEKFLSFLSQFGKRDNSSIDFKISDKSYVPRISFKFAACSAPQAIFDASKTIEVGITNTTGQTRKSPFIYSSISLDEFIFRAKELSFEFLDHAGFDVPWFDGVHPDINKLRDFLPEECLYSRYPTGEDWDFIIPATQKEIATRELDYRVIRRPKFEIVFLNYSSTPIVQFDVSVKESFEEIRKIFPEGYPDNSLKNAWIYVENPYGIEICFVVGHRGNADWYKFLKKGLINYDNNQRE